MKSQYIVLGIVKILIKCEWLLPANEPVSEKKKCMLITMEGSEIYPTFKLVCHSYMDSDRKHKTRGLETKDIMIYSDSSSKSVSIFLSWFLK